MKTYGVALVAGALLAGANYALVGQRPEIAACGVCLVLLLAGPLVVTLAVAAVVGPPPSVPVVTTPAAPPAAPPDPVENAALRLLATLQEEGRLVDFFTEDIAPYSDEQVGAATRGIHASCQKALKSAVAMEPIVPGDEGATVTVPAGFDPAAIRLVGNVTGAPPFTGVLRHAGWRATAVDLPPRGGQDPKVIAPAEVEIE
jgi:uncharacterized protein DUF2760